MYFTFLENSNLYLQWLAEKLAASLSGIRKIAVVFIIDELQKSLLHGLKNSKFDITVSIESFKILKVIEILG